MCLARECTELSLMGCKQPTWTSATASA